MFAIRSDLFAICTICSQSAPIQSQVGLAYSQSVRIYSQSEPVHSQIRKKAIADIIVREKSRIIFSPEDFTPWRIILAAIHFFGHIGFILNLAFVMFGNFSDHLRRKIYEPHENYYRTSNIFFEWQSFVRVKRATNEKRQVMFVLHMRSTLYVFMSTSWIGQHTTTR